jgi:hypothetical protein
MRDYSKDRARIEQASAEAQRLIDDQEAKAFALVDMYEAMGPGGVDAKQAFDWFFSRRVLDAVPEARRTGHAQIRYICFEDIDEAERLVEKIDDLNVLENYEPSRRSRKRMVVFKIEAVRNLLPMCRTMFVGDASIGMTREHLAQETDSDWTPTDTADNKWMDLADFVGAWQDFREESGIDLEY